MAVYRQGKEEVFLFVYYHQYILGVYICLYIQCNFSDCKIYGGYSLSYTLNPVNTYERVDLVFKIVQCIVKTS